MMKVCKIRTLCGLLTSRNISAILRPCTFSHAGPRCQLKFQLTFFSLAGSMIGCSNHCPESGKWLYNCHKALHSKPCGNRLLTSWIRETVLVIRDSYRLSLCHQRLQMLKMSPSLSTVTVNSSLKRSAKALGLSVWMGIMTLG